MCRDILVRGMFLTLSLCVAPAFACDPSCASGSGSVPGDLVWEGAVSSARLGTSVAYAGDLNGDGRAELIAGAPNAKENGLPCGKAYVLAAPAGARGAIPVTGATALATIFTAKKNSLLGASVAGLGDFDGDGFNDLAVGLPGALGHVDGDDDDKVAYTGAVQIIYGAADLPAAIDIDALSATRIVGAGPGEQAGFAIAAAGDVNGDGMPDLIIGAPYASPKTKCSLDQSGRAYIIFGGGPRRAIIDLERDADVTIEGCQSYARLGMAVAGSGDINGDGIDDFAVGAPYMDTGGYTDAGEVLVIFGARDLPATINSGASLDGIGLRFSGRANSIKLGWALAGADVNGDGFSDLVAGAPRGGAKLAGSAYILFGGAALPAALATNTLGDKGAVITGAFSYGYLGLALAAVGDVNADGLADIAIGAPEVSNGVLPLAGAVYVLNGRAVWPQSSGIAAVASRTILGARTNAAFGEALSRAGDHDGDGGPDFAVGVPRQSPDNLSCAGQVSVFLGESLPGPSDLTCVTTLLDVILAWTNNYDYEELVVTRDGEPLATLPGAATGYTDLAVPVGTHVYTVAGIAAGGIAAGAVECTVHVQVLPIRRPECAADAKVVSLTWSLGMAYDAIRVARNGVLLAELPGDACAWTDADAPYGALSYAITGILGAHASIPATCEVYVARPPYKLACAVDGTTVALSWTEPEIFDRVEILKDGAFLTVLPGGAAGFNDTNVAPGPHTYALRAFVGASAAEPVVCLVTVVPAPFDASCAAAEFAVAMEWNLAADYDAIAVFIDGERVATLPGDARTFALDGLAPGVHLIEAAGELEGVLSARVPCTVEILAPPADLVCAAEGGRVVLAWRNGSTYGEIVVLRDGAEIAHLPGGTNTFTDTNAAPGPHAYEIYGAADRAVSARAACEITVLDPPVDFTCAAVGNVVKLTWVNTSAYEEIVIARDGATVATLPGTATDYVDSGVARGSHVYTLQGFAGDSRSVDALCETVSLGAPSALACTALGAAVTLAWTNGDAYDAIRVLRNATLLAVLPGGAQEYVDTTVAAGQTYDYEIIGATGASISEPASCRMALPLAPVALACTAAGNRVRLSWEIAGAADAVVVTRDAAKVAELPAGTTVFEEPVPVPGVYVYGVSTVLGDAQSALVQCTVATIAPPEAFTCVAAGGVVTLNWTVAEGYDALVLSRNGAEIARLPGDAVAYQDGGIAPGDYVYTLVAESGRSTASASCEVHAPAPPANLNCFVVEGAITLSWENAEAYDEIVLFRNEVQHAVLSGDSVTYRDAEAEPGTVYAYVLVARRGLDRTPPAACTLKIPAPVTELECTVAGDDVTLRWTAGDAYDQIRITRNGQTISSSLPGTTTAYEDRALAPGSYAYEVTGLIGGARSPAARCEVVVVPAPAELVCAIVAEAGKVRLAWTNPALYEGIAIARNGEEIARLPGSAVEFIEEAPEPGTWVYAVTGAAFGSESPPATCALAVLEPPSAVECAADGATITLSWVLGGTYAEIRVLRNGALIATLPGTDTSFTDHDRPPGTYVYRLIGAGAPGSGSCASAPCTVEAVAPPEQLLCSASMSGASMTVALRWSLAGGYDSQIIERSGPDGSEFIAQIGGTETTYTDSVGKQGIYTYRVIANIGLNSAPSEPCTVEIAQPRFLRGDANADRTVDLADVVFTLNALFRGGPQPPCRDAADANDDGRIDTSDTVYTIDFLFRDGPPPPPPFPQIGFDPTPDPYAPGGDLGCEAY